MENPLTFRCERMGCHYSSTFRTAEDYERWVSHHLTKDCPLKGNKIRFGRGAIVTVLKELWEHADRTLDAFLKPGTMLTGNEYTKGELGGQCYAIWKISGVYYATLEDVKQELMARKAAREAGNTDHVTPGLANITIAPEEPTVLYPHLDGKGGETGNPAWAGVPPVGYPQERIDAARAAHDAGGYVYAPTPGAYTSERPKVGGGPRVARATPPTPRTTGRSFTDEEKAKVKSALSAGFDAKMLAISLKCSEAEILALAT